MKIHHWAFALVLFFFLVAALPDNYLVWSTRYEPLDEIAGVPDERAPETMEELTRKSANELPLVLDLSVLAPGILSLRMLTPEVAGMELSDIE